MNLRPLLSNFFLQLLCQIPARGRRFARATTRNRCPLLHASRDQRRARRAGPAKMEMYERYQTNLSVAPVPALDDDAPLPQRHLARLSHSSSVSERSGQVTSTPGAARGLLHSQLQQLNVHEIVNMLLPDSGVPQHSRHPSLPSQPSVSAAAAPDLELSLIHI